MPLSTESEQNCYKEDNLCPICYEIMDKTDIRLFPCRCDFQICIWCLNNLVSNGKPCPNCRKPYDKDLYRTIYDDQNSDENENNESNSTTTHDVNEGHSRNSIHRKMIIENDLSSIRVVKKDLVYVIGISTSNTDIDFLSGDTMFGKYGIVKRIIVNFGNEGRISQSTCGMYITYESDAAALSCIRSIDGYSYKGHILKASYGTTKYCNIFVRGEKCLKPDCIYLHELADPMNCFSRRNMLESHHKFYMHTHPGSGAIWEPNQQIFMYKKCSSTNDEFPDPEIASNSMSDTEDRMAEPKFGLPAEEMDEVKILGDVQLSSLNIMSSSEIIFSALILDNKRIKPEIRLNLIPRNAVNTNKRNQKTSLSKQSRYACEHHSINNASADIDLSSLFGSSEKERTITGFEDSVMNEDDIIADYLKSRKNEVFQSTE